MQVNKSFSVQGSAILDVPLSNCCLIQGMADGRRVLRLLSERPAGEIQRRKRLFLSMSINMSAQESRLLGCLILGADDPIIRLAQRVADLNRDAGEIGAGMLASLVDDARAALGREG